MQLPFRQSALGTCLSDHVIKEREQSGVEFESQAV